VTVPHPLLLAISTSSPALSIALVAGPRVLVRRHELIGRGHAEALVPGIATLLAGQPRPDAIVVDIGPGSYTGIRIGIAAARALALAWAVPVYGVSALALVAAQAFAADPALGEVLAVIDAGRGQPVGGMVTRDFAMPAPRAVSDVSAAAATAGAGMLLLAPDRPALHHAHPDVAHAGLVAPAAMGQPTALYLDD
jgi:tRNA threonylcarbamoyl adenosine modification protein YeaZ